MPTKPEHHVIFLGAGASATSGYPVGEHLRLRICSESRFVKDLDESITERERGNAIDFRKAFYDQFIKFADSVELFRHGGFATVDEFSKLASEEYSDKVVDMKKLMRLALMVHNPETNFQDSDYYPFVQKLFDRDLFSLKPGITVLSYNYDCYLDFLLMKAHAIRNKLRNQQEPNDDIKNSLSSGFFKPESTQWTRSHLPFKYYKLHGSISYVNGADCSHNDIFNSEIAKRIPPIFQSARKTTIPPIVFPWELFGQNQFISLDQFYFTKHAQTDEEKTQAKTLLGLLEEIWEGARRAVQQATKISFVGISMHHFMEQGLKFLFEGKLGPVDVVVANKHDAEKLGDVVRKVLIEASLPLGQKLVFLGEDSKHDQNYGATTRPRYSVRTVGSFHQFIQDEMT